MTAECIYLIASVNIIDDFRNVQPSSLCALSEVNIPVNIPDSRNMNVLKAARMVFAMIKVNI